MTLAYWLFHPLYGRGYQFWSGIGSDIGELTLVGAIVTVTVIAVKAYRHQRELHQCHIEGCTRTSWHTHPDHGHQVCRRHHPDGAGLPREDHES